MDIKFVLAISLIMNKAKQIFIQFDWIRIIIKFRYPTSPIFFSLVRESIFIKVLFINLIIIYFQMLIPCFKTTLILSKFVFYFYNFFLHFIFSDFSSIFSFFDYFLILIFSPSFNFLGTC